MQGYIRGISCLAVCACTALLAMISGPCSAETQADNGGKTVVIPCIDVLKSDAGKGNARAALLKQIHEQTVDAGLAVPLTEKTEDRWDGACWGMEITLYRTPKVKESLRYALNTNKEHSSSIIRSIMEAVWTLYRHEFVPEMEKVARETNNPKNFAMAASYVVMNNPKKAKELYKLSFREFPDNKNDFIIQQLRRNLEESFTERLKRRPPLVDLLSQKFPGDLPVAFSFQRRERDYPGLIVVRKQDGTFVRRADGSVFNVSQIARSMGNYPGYMTNGNTPQGIFSMQRFETDPNPFIGPTPTLIDVLPFEETVANYFHDPSRSGEKWTVEAYEKMLPTSWKGYEPFYETYRAGEIGRGEMIGHGTTIDPDFYKGLPYYPNTPSLGCLCALELWSPVDGRCVYSDQLALMKAFESTGVQKGYVVVVELDNECRPVNLYDVLDDLVKAERR